MTADVEWRHPGDVLDEGRRVVRLGLESEAEEMEPQLAGRVAERGERRASRRRALVDPTWSPGVAPVRRRQRMEGHEQLERRPVDDVERECAGRRQDADDRVAQAHSIVIVQRSMAVGYSSPVEPLCGERRMLGLIGRSRDFRLLWAAHTVSVSGDAVTLVALPTIAILTLHATGLAVGS